MISSIVSRLVILVFGNLYPAYASYKAVRTKNVKEYVKWMMYWIVFALFTCAETFTDVFFSFWFPFYYEIKTILVIWLLSPATKGSSILYRRFVHPALIRREAEIDETLARVTEQGYSAVLHLGSKGVNYATTVLMQTAIKGGGGLVQHLKKSYSLSDLTSEKEDENRNTSHLHDETDIAVEPRRREHVGRRSYSPRRTQSSSNRVEMYFSEVDVDVRQPRSREPTISLTNIRSSDDISSGYSSGEALQSTRSSQGDTLVRTSSVGARTRAKPRSTTKKTPEEAGEDPDSNEFPSSINISLPTPLSHVTPEQALEILLLLSQNSNVADYIKLDRGSFVAGNDDPVEKTSQSGPEFLAIKAESKESDDKPLDSSLTAEVQIIQSIEMKTVPENVTMPEKLTDDTPSHQVAQVQETVAEVVTKSSMTDQAPSTVSEDTVKNEERTLTDELCQTKFDELKHLLSEAHRAVNNIVYTQEQLKGSNTSIAVSSQKDVPEKVDTNKDSKNDNTEDKELSKDAEQMKTAEETNKADDTTKLETGNLDVATPEGWATANMSQSISDSLNRAGKYNKKPAPKIPLTTSEEDLNEIDSQNALKATLVIKTGTVKTFANPSQKKDVFIAHVAEKSKGKKSKRQRTKEGFSKLLTIPKNIFHSAFHREHRGSGRSEDSASDISAPQSRSNSIEPQEMIIELAPKLPISSQDTTTDDKSDSSNSSDTYVLASSAESLEAETKQEVEVIDETKEKVEAVAETKEKVETAAEANEKVETAAETKEKVQTTTEMKKKIETAAESPKPEIKEMSHSPRVIKKLESDIY
ncbi:uncharacterized protein LOC116427684 [Nomia melanderi]|uniref:uncharacterized protein LOC116427684 n=1 Tax=Nomia melanderi TaxID=2448451 RepID=UPI001304555C|nr:microtubule-associated protein futsch-like [Nomia melanderi]